MVTNLAIPSEIRKCAFSRCYLKKRREWSKKVSRDSQIKKSEENVLDIVNVMETDLKMAHISISTYDNQNL